MKQQRLATAFFAQILIAQIALSNPNPNLNATLPTASFNYSANHLNVSFSNTSANAASFFWFFGDAGSGGQNFSTQANPTHHFSAPGTYVVELTATNSEGSHTVSQTVSVTCPPLSVSLWPGGNTNICPGSTLNLNATPGFASYTWLVNGGAVSGASGPVFQTNIPGDFSVVASDGQGCSAISNTVAVAFLPLALPQFNWEKHNLRLTTENNSTNVDLNSWDFGDGSPVSHEVSPVHYFPAPGTYTVVLTVSNGCTARTSQYDINFTCPYLPSSISTPGPAEACPASAIPLTATAGYTKYLWQKDGTPFPWATDATFWANEAGDYTVVVTEETGCASVSPPFHVNQKPPAMPSFSFSVNDLTASFSNTSTNADSISWNFGDGSTAVQTANPTHNFPAAGTYQVVLLAANECGVLTDTQTVTVTCPSIAVGLSAIGPTAFCPGGSVQLNAPPGFQNYLWQRDNSLILGANAASFLASEAGNYAVVATDSTGCSGVSDAVQILIKPLAEPAFNFSANDLTASFSNTSANANAFVWNFGDGSPADSTASPTHQFSAPGTYQVLLTAANDCGPQAFTQSVTVVCPAVSVSVSPTDTAICLGQSAMLSATPGFQNYVWSLDGTPIPFATVSTIFPSTEGDYSVVAFNIPACPSAAAHATVTLKFAPLSQFSFQKNDLSISFSNTSTNADSYFWDFGDGSTSTEPNPTHTFSSPGNFPVTLTVTNGCGSSTATQTVSPTVSTALPDGFESLSVFPNPASGAFYLKMKLTRRKSLTFNLLNGIGQNFGSRFLEIFPGEEVLKFELGGLPDGTYFLEILEDGKRVGIMPIQSK